MTCQTVQTQGITSLHGQNTLRDTERYHAWLSVQIDDVSEQLLLRPRFADASPPRFTSLVDVPPAGPSCNAARASERARERGVGGSGLKEARRQSERLVPRDSHRRMQRQREEEGEATDR
jgi:hypothetical protein